MVRRELMAMMALAANVPLSNPAPAHASGKTWIDELQSSNVPGGVRVSIYTPPAMVAGLFASQYVVSIGEPNISRQA